MSKPLHIPPSKKLKGLKIHCYECGTTVGDTCKKSGSPIGTCKHGSAHVFKVYAHVPGTGNARKTKTLVTRDLDEARRQALAFQKEVKEAAAEKAKEIPGPIPETTANALLPIPSPVLIQEAKSFNLLELTSLYVGFMHNDNVAEFRQRQRSKKHLEDVERFLTYFVVSLRDSNFPVEAIRVDAVSDHMIAAYLKHLQERKLSNASYNRGIGVLSAFYNYLNREGFQLRNPFASIPRKPKQGDKKTITRREYEQLLEIVQRPELGVQILSTGEKKYHHHWFLRDSIELGALTGRRNGEIVEMTWDGIHTDELGNLKYIEVPDFKANRKQGNYSTGGAGMKKVYVPITAPLNNLLQRMGYEKYKGSDKYILAPEESMKRSTLNAIMSYAFKHYYNQIGSGRQLSYKCLRKTYISQLAAFMGLEKARQITKHSDIAIMENNYVDDSFIALTAAGFNHFATETADQEVEELRTKKPPSKDSSLER